MSDIAVAGMSGSACLSHVHMWPTANEVLTGYNLAACEPWLLQLASMLPDQHPQLAFAVQGLPRERGVIV